MALVGEQTKLFGKKKIEKNISKFEVMITKKYKLVFEEYKPEKLKGGMYTNKGVIYKVPVDDEKFYSVCTGEYDGARKAFSKRSLKALRPFIIDDSDSAVFDNPKETIMFLVGKQWFEAYFDDLLGNQIKKVAKIIARPEQIGLVERVTADHIDSADTPNSERFAEYEIFTGKEDNDFITAETVKYIMEECDGECQIEMIEMEGDGCGIRIPRLTNNKITIYL